jgi:hypothetical protein
MQSPANRYDSRTHWCGTLSLLLVHVTSDASGTGVQAAE